VPTVVQDVGIYGVPLECSLALTGQPCIVHSST
jgi:hypothetical protein